MPPITQQNLNKLQSQISKQQNILNKMKKAGAPPAAYSGVQKIVSQMEKGYKTMQKIYAKQTVQKPKYTPPSPKKTAAPSFKRKAPIGAPVPKKTAISTSKIEKTMRQIDKMRKVAPPAVRKQLDKQYATLQKMYSKIKVPKKVPYGFVGPVRPGVKRETKTEYQRRVVKKPIDIKKQIATLERLKKFAPLPAKRQLEKAIMARKQMISKVPAKVKVPTPTSAKIEEVKKYIIKSRTERTPIKPSDIQKIMIGKPKKIARVLPPPPMGAPPPVKEKPIWEQWGGAIAGGLEQAGRTIGGFVEKAGEVVEAGVKGVATVVPYTIPAVVLYKSLTTPQPKTPEELSKFDKKIGNINKSITNIKKQADILEERGAPEHVVSVMRNRADLMHTTVADIVKQQEINKPQYEPASAREGGSGINDMFFEPYHDLGRVSSNLQGYIENIRKADFEKGKDYTITMDVSQAKKLFKNVPYIRSQFEGASGIQELVLKGSDANRWKTDELKVRGEQDTKIQTYRNELWQEGRNAQDNWHPDTVVVKYNPMTHHYEGGKVVEGKTEGATKDMGWRYAPEFPYGGAESYGIYHKQLKGGGFGGLLATALTGEDPIGLASAYYTATGEKQKALDVKIKALHGVKTVHKAWEESPLEGLKSGAMWWASMPTTQIGLAAIGGEAFGSTLGYASQIAPKVATGLKVAGLGVGVYGGYGEAQNIIGMYERGEYGELLGHGATMGLAMYGGVKSFKKGYQRGEVVARRHKLLAHIKDPAERLKFKRAFEVMDEVQNLDLPKSERLKIERIAGIKDNPSYVPKSNELPIKNLTQREAAAVQKAITTLQKKYGIQIGGSASQYVGTGGKTRIGHDIDILVKKRRIGIPQEYVEGRYPTKGFSGLKAKVKMRIFTKLGLKGESKVDEMAREASRIIQKELQIKPGSKQWNTSHLKSLVDIHDKPKVGGLLREISYGSKAQKPYKSGIFREVMSVPEQAGRKFQTYIDPQHLGRGKDIPDFFKIAKMQVEAHPFRGRGLSSRAGFLEKWSPQIEKGGRRFPVFRTKTGEIMYKTPETPTGIMKPGTSYYEMHPELAPVAKRGLWGKHLWKSTLPPERAYMSTEFPKSMEWASVKFEPAPPSIGSRFKTWLGSAYRGTLPEQYYEPEVHKPWHDTVAQPVQKGEHWEPVVHKPWHEPSIRQPTYGVKPSYPTGYSAKYPSAYPTPPSGYAAYPTTPSYPVSPITKGGYPVGYKTPRYPAITTMQKPYPTTPVTKPVYPEYKQPYEISKSYYPSYPSKPSYPSYPPAPPYPSYPPSPSYPSYPPYPPAPSYPPYPEPSYPPYPPAPSYPSYPSKPSYPPYPEYPEEYYPEKSVKTYYPEQHVSPLKKKEEKKLDEEKLEGYKERAYEVPNIWKATGKTLERWKKPSEVPRPEWAGSFSPGKKPKFFTLKK